MLSNIGHGMNMSIYFVIRSSRYKIHNSFYTTSYGMKTSFEILYSLILSIFIGTHCISCYIPVSSHNEQLIHIFTRSINLHLLKQCLCRVGSISKVIVNERAVQNVWPGLIPCFLVGVHEEN